MDNNKPTPTISYLKTQLGFTLGEWSKLDKETQDWYRNAAKEEMDTLGIAHS